MALSGELAKYIGNEFVGAGRKGLAKAGSKAGSKSALSSLVPSVASEVGDDIASKAGGSSLRKLLVNQAPSIAEEIPVAVGDAGKISLYRGMHADSPANLQKYIAEMKDPNIVPRTYTGNAFAGDGYHFYDNIEGAREYALDGMNLGEPYSAVVKIDVPKNRFIGINSQNGNDAESFIGRALERGAKNAPEVGNKDFRNYIQQNGILGSHNTSPFGDSSQYVVMNNDATAGLEAIENYENGQLMEDIVNSGADKYLPVGTKIKFNKDLNISSVEKPATGRGWWRTNENNPHIARSLADEPKIIYHGTPNKFEDFDDSLPSVWFSDSDKNLKDTGLSIKGGQSMNVMERQLPRDLKIADEDLADRLTKQQLQDRGYAGIAYTERGPNGDETHYEIFKPNETLKKLEAKLPDVRMSYGYGGGYGSYDENVKRIGSSDVAPVREETLPDGWKQLEKYLDNSNDRLSIALGKPRSKISKQDLISFLEGEGYYDESLKTKDQLWKQALQMIDDQALDEFYETGGRAGSFLEGRLPFRNNPGLTDATNYYIGAKGRTGRLDAEYSDRLGIGRSNTPMSDRLVNPYGGASGDYSEGAFGTDPTWATGESGVSTSAHERMHAWQDIDKFQYDEGVENAIDELRGELKKFYHNTDEIKKYWGNGKTDYYARDIEQEARMLQSYLDNEGFTNTYRKTSDKGMEWGDEIKPAFDKFFKKLRELSKKGIALPAIAGLFGLGALAGSKNDDKNIK